MYIRNIKRTCLCAALAFALALPCLPAAAAQAADFTLPASWFDASGDTKTFNGTGSLVVSDALLGVDPNGGPVAVTLTVSPMTVEVLQGEKVLGPDFAHPMLLSFPYTLRQDENPDTVAVCRIQSDEEQKQAIPRSWYKEGHVYAYLYGSGRFFAQNFESAPFSDTRGHWMESSVAYMAARGVIAGQGRGLFSPDNRVTRAEFVTMLMRTLNTDITFRPVRPFNDQLSFPAYAAPHIQQALGLGIVMGDAGGNFNPNADITRQDMFVMLARAMETFSMIAPSESGMTLRAFGDAADIAPYAQLPLLTLVQNGLVAGHNNRLFPRGSASRAEAAQLLYNVLRREAV